jgi:predicted acyl esterase
MLRSHSRFGTGRPIRRVVGLVVGLTLLGATASVASASSHEERCRDPYPCERAWPEGLTGPFALKEVRNVQVRSHDGTLLDGWIASPTVPAGVRTPTLLMSSPYFDYVGSNGAGGHPGGSSLPGCEEAGVNCGFWYDGPGALGSDLAGIPLIRLIRRGYTVALFSVRGTGSSGGCFEFGSRKEQRDQVALVDWLAKQPWSNGRIGMGGLSYPSFTTWQAAVQAPKALKAIVTAGDVVDVFQLIHSPQGSRSGYDSVYLSGYDGTMGLTAGALSGRPEFLERKGCPEAGVGQRSAEELVAETRDAAYWKERNLTLRLPSVRAAVLDTTGYKDIIFHHFQGDSVWGSLARSTPKVQVRGWWAHEYPHPDNSVATKLDLPSGTVTWEGMVTRWFDYWLKGIGQEPPTPRVFHQDQDLRWHESSTWSARPQGTEVLHLNGAELAPGAGRGATSFRSMPTGDLSWGTRLAASTAGVETDGSGIEPSLCQDPVGAQASRLYLTKPVASRTLVAGNPFAYLRLSSDQPGGIVSASLYDVSPEFACSGPRFSGARWMALGSADLSYHNSPFLAQPFPVGTPVPVRIDLTDVTWALAPGHRLALVLSFGEAWERTNLAQSFPTITVQGDSQLVVPVADGTLGGMRPALRYPPRPFTPRSYWD